MSNSSELKDLHEAMVVYLTAVAVGLLHDGDPVETIRPYPEKPGTDDPESEGEASLYFGRAYYTRHFGADVIDGSLYWDTLSGWRLTIERLGEDGKNLDEDYWMGKGLVPDPRAVANFLTAAKVDLEGAGSPETPFYRDRGQDIPALTARLNTYADNLVGHEPPSFLPARPLNIFRHQRTLKRSDVVAEALTAGGDTLRLVPLTEGEVKAIGRLAEWAEPLGLYPQPDFLRLLASDLTDRYTRISSTARSEVPDLATAHRTAQAAAVTHLEKNPG
ncbi:hypothetical protein [Kitasatospora sp. NPDC001527]|uniref:hypothetical protein n=1 Tax=Kitasatospora sp. NPDC001527 TaxID=3154519 RepID=UPI0033308868